MKDTILMLLFLLLIIGIGGCENKEEITTILPIANTPDYVNAFFEAELPVMTESNCFFASKKNDTCYLINSKEELAVAYSCEISLPEINFELYSVIIGQNKMPNSFYTVVNQSIEKTNDVLKLNVYVKLLSKEHWPAFSQLYYWAVYPKLPNKNVNVNIINKEQS